MGRILGGADQADPVQPRRRGPAVDALEPCPPRCGRPRQHARRDAREPAGRRGGAGREAGRRGRASRSDPGARRDARPRQGLRRDPGHEVPCTAAGGARVAADADAHRGLRRRSGRRRSRAGHVVASAPIDPSLVDVADAWGQAWRPRLANFGPAQAALFTQCSLASGVVPSAAWRKRTAELVATDDARDMAHGMLDDTMVAGHHQTFRTYQYEGREYRVWNPAIVEANVALVRGAMWAAAAVNEPWVDAILLDIGLHFGTSGTSSNEVRDERLANSAAAALGSRRRVRRDRRARADEGHDRQPERVEADREGARGRGRASRDQPVGAARARRSHLRPRRRRAARDRGRRPRRDRGHRRRRRPADLARAGRAGDRDGPRGDRGPEGRRHAREGTGEGAPQGSRTGARANRGPVHRGPGVVGRGLASEVSRASAHGLDRPPADLDGAA